MGNTNTHTKGRLNLTVKSGVLGPNHPRPTQKLLKIYWYRNVVQQSNVSITVLNQMACLAAQKARRAIRNHEAFLCACMASPGAPGAPGEACGVQRQARAAGAGSARALVPAYIPAPSPHAHGHGQTLARNFRAAPTPPAPQDTGAATGASARMATYTTRKDQRALKLQ